MNDKTIISGTSPDDIPILSILYSIKFTVGVNGKCNIAFKNCKLQNDFLYYEDIKYNGRICPSILKYDIDHYAWRSFTDMVVQGCVRSAIPQKSLKIKFNCKGNHFGICHEIEATGNRHIEKDRRGIHLTEPEPFTEMPMRYDKAYGGTDELAEKKHTDPAELEMIRLAVGAEEDLEMSEYSYPRNPAGKGYIIDPEGLVGLAWPNLEFSNEKLTLDNLIAPLNEWGKRPYPACFDWFPHAWFPRVAFFGEFPPTHDGKVPQKEIDIGILEKHLHLKSLMERPKHGFAQGSHPYLWGHRFQGNEEIRITRMSKDGRDFYVKLPNHIPKIKVRLFGGEVHQLQPMLDLVFIETEKDQVTLLWRGSTPTGKDFLPPNWKEQCEYSVDW